MDIYLKGSLYSLAESHLPVATAWPRESVRERFTIALGIICDCDSLHHRSRRFVQRAVVRGCGSAGGAGTCGITFYVYRVVHDAPPPAPAPAAGGGTDTFQLHTATSIFLKAATQQAHETLVHPRKRRKCAKASYKGQVFF